MPLFRKKHKEYNDTNGHSEKSSDSLSKTDVKRASRTRLIAALFTSFFLLVTVVFLIIVEVANTSTGKAITDIYFIRLNLSNIIPESYGNAQLLNSIAQTLGLHDYYQVGLWNYCEGYLSSGTTSCSDPETLYWFNPVEIIRNQLIAGATVQLPSDLTDILDIIETASHVMFGLFLTGAVLSFVLMFLLPLAVFSRWVAFVLSIFAFLNALFITAASVIATVMFIIMRNVFTDNQDVNIVATIGTTMFACMWVASAFAILAWLVQMGLCCCCVSRRDVKTGRKGYSKPQ